MSFFEKPQLRQQLIKKLGNNAFSGQIDSAFNLAFTGHDGQFRDSKDDGQVIPYIVHPVGVALLAAELMPLVNLEDSVDDVISACLTHDLLEDTSIDQLTLADATSPRTSELVLFLTKPIITGELTREARNKIVSARIMEGGLSAMFIKLCDHMHNISRPTHTPVHLLSKAVAKGYSEYLNYFGLDLLPDSMRKVYLQRLDHASECLDAHEVQNAKKIYSLEAAIEVCLQRTKGKILELHDVQSILSQVTSPKFIRVLTWGVLLQEISASLNGKLRNQWLSKLIQDLSNGWLELSKYPKQVRHELSLGCDYLFCEKVLFDDIVQEENSLIVGFNNPLPSTWISHSTIKFLLSSITIGLNKSFGQQVQSISHALYHYGLDANAIDVLDGGWGVDDLERVSQWIDYSKVTLIHLSKWVETIFRDEEKELPSVQSRIKSLTSILKKIRRKNLANYSEIDDLVGLRIVCLGSSEVIQVSDQLQTELQKEFRLLDNNVSMQQLSLQSGYEAVHIGFSVLVETKNTRLSIPCEIQIKTVFQDAWAKAYRALVYGEDRPSKEAKKVFAELARLCKESDSSLEEYLNALPVRQKPGVTNT